MKFRDSIKWFGTALFGIGAIALSISPKLALELWPFIAFLVGHTIWATTGILARDRAIIALNMMYIPLDIYAIFTRII